MFFDHLAEGWSARYQSPDFAARLQRFESALQGLPLGSHILDFGCGAGDIARHLRDCGWKVTGLDVSAKMIAHCRRVHAARDLHFDRYSGSGSLPVPDRTFDAVIASSVLEYVSEMDALLFEMHRVLRPNGLLCASVPDPRHPVRRREAALIRLLSWPGMMRLARHTRWREGAGYLRLSVNRFDLNEWRRRLELAGFNAVTAIEHGPLMMLRATAAA